MKTLPWDWRSCGRLISPASSPGRRVLRESEGDQPTNGDPEGRGPMGGEAPCLGSGAVSSSSPSGVHTRDSVDADSSTPVLDQDWSTAYDLCPKWGPIFRKVRGPTSGDWPRGVRVDRGKMYDDGLLCVPSELTGLVIRVHHGEAGHPGASRLWHQLGRWYRLANPKEAEKCAQGIQRACEVCQACDPARAPYRCLLEATRCPHTSWSAWP